MFLAYASFKRLYRRVTEIIKRLRRKKNVQGSIFIVSLIYPTVSYSAKLVYSLLTSPVLHFAVPSTLILFDLSVTYFTPFLTLDAFHCGIPEVREKSECTTQCSKDIEPGKEISARNIIPECFKFLFN